MKHLSPDTILVVDDDQGARVLAKGLIRQVWRESIRIDLAETYEKAIEFLEQNSYSVLLVDYFLDGGRTGTDILQYVQEHGIDAPVILLTGNEEEDLPLELLRAGASDYLMKDQITSRVLQRSIRYALQRRQNEVERRQIEMLERERNALRDSLAGFEQVLGVVGHELRTPLAGIRAMAEYLLTSKLEQRETALKFVDSINCETVRLAGVVNDLLEIARINSGAAKWNWGDVPIQAACTEALRVVYPLLDPSCVELRTEIIPETLTMRGDFSAVTRLIHNLAMNSLRNTEKGSIVIRGKSEQDWIVLEVADTGSGIPPALLERLGEAFVFNSGVVGERYNRGSGLGLAIVRGIVAAHGGTIHVSTSLGKGTAFIVKLKSNLDGAAAQQDAPFSTKVEG